MPFTRFFVPIDGSAISSAALGFAIARAKRHGAEMTVGFAENRIPIEIALAEPYGYFDPTPLLQALDDEANAVLGAAETQAQAASVRVGHVKLDGPAGPAIVAYAQETHPSAIVMGTHGRSGLDRLAIGSTAEEVVRRAGVPVFVVPKGAVGARTPETLAHLLVAIDGSPASNAALLLACEIARVEQSRLTLCTVAESTAVERDANVILEESRVRAAALGVAVESQLAHGDAQAEIVRVACAAGADAIVMGTHGRAGIPRFILGSVASAVLRLTPIPVCTVRHR